MMDYWKTLRGEEGALMIDGGLAANADALLKAVRERTGNSSRTHTDQHARPDFPSTNLTT